MEVSIDVWRSRATCNSIRNCALIDLLSVLSPEAIISTISTILIIGGVELNPGPFPCNLCPIVPQTVASSIRHQHSHAEKDPNFMYQCPVLGCVFETKSYNVLDNHVSTCHRQERHVDPEANHRYHCEIEADEKICTFSCTSLWVHVQHLYQHLESGTEVTCPLSGCDRVFKKKGTFQGHLSSYHPGWRDEGVSKKDTADLPGVNEAMDCDLPIPTEGQTIQDHSSTDNIEEDQENLQEDCSSSDEHILLNDDLFLDTIGIFYLDLYADKTLAQAVIQGICGQISTLTQIAHARMKTVLTKSLQDLGLEDDQINLISNKVLTADLLHSAHHKNMPGPSMTSHYLRKRYFEKRFHFFEPTEVPLDPEDPDSDKKLQFVSIKRSLSVLLNDPSIVKEVKASFSRPADDNTVSDYQDGSLFKSENHPQKEIQLLLYQDSYNPALNVLGSAKNKYKQLVMYFTIGNLKPYLRSKIKSKHLVLICRESIFKAVGSAKCLEKVMVDLKDLEQDGVMFQEENIKVVVEFMLGDSLGQHLIGGFIESFSGRYFCRFCPIKGIEFRADPTLVKPQRTIEEYNACVLKAKLTGENSKGIKSGCELNVLKYFHAVSHLPPCKGHDLDEGCISWDLAGIIARFVDKKWFTYDLLNDRIRNFTCKGIDSTNKPAAVNKNGKKLGGHAVQNWTLLRLFPIIIGDLIQDFEDPGWQLYLQLKEISEHVSVPFYKKREIPYIRDVLLPAYFLLRAEVLCQIICNLRPKHHFLCHYCDLLLKYGPLLFLWTMPFEQAHKFFKDVMRHGKNFINPEFTCAERYQMKFAYDTLKPLFEDVLSVTKPKELSIASFSGRLALFLSSLNLTGWHVSPCISINHGITYQKRDVLLFSKEGNCMTIGILEVIAFKEKDVVFILENKKAMYNPILGIYEISMDHVGDYMSVSPGALVYPVPQPIYLMRGKSVFSLKHKISDVTDS